MIKKVIPIFMFIFSIFLIGNNKVFADDSIQTINFPASSVARLLENASTKSLDFFSKDSNTYKYTINALNFINNKEYKNYGEYYFIDYFGDDIPLVYITDYPELLTIIAYDEDVSDGTRGHFTYHINYDSSKPIYRYKPSRKSYPVEISSAEIQDGGHLWGFAKTELEDPYFIRSNFPEVRIIGGRTLQLSDVSYSNSEAVFLGHQDGSVSLNKYSINPTLKIDFLESKYNNDVFLYNKYRLSVENFNDDYVYYMGKMSEENSDMTSYNKYSEFYYENKYFRVLYGKENQMHLNNDKTYFDFILNKNDTIIVEVRDKENNYITSMTYTVTSIDETEKVLPYITTDEASTCKVTYKGKDYITCKTYTINAHFSDLTSYYLYLSTDNGETFNKVDTNYGVYTFSGKNNNENFIFKVLDKDGNYITSASYTITGISNYDDIKTFVYINVDETIGYDDELNYYYGSVYYWIYNWDSSYKLYYREDNCPKNDDKYRIYPLSHSDSLYGIGYKYTRDLYACFVVYDKDDNYLYSMTHSFYMENVYQNNNSAFYKFLDKWWTNISAPFTVFKQFVEIIKSLDYSPTSTMAPSFTVDFSYFGVEKSQSIIDFTWYLKYRDTIFNFIYLVFGFITGVKVIHNLRHVFGGGS